jgi:N-acetylglucosamine-6-sulfatase
MHAHGVVDNFSRLPDSIPTFPKLLKKAGYRTAFLGKWHMGDAALSGGVDFSDLPQGGFDHWIGCKGQGEYRNPELNFNGLRRRVNGYFTDILTEEALRFISKSGGEPYLLYVSHKAVHAGFDVADRHKGRYSGAPVSVPASAALREGKPAWLLRKREVSRHGLAHLYEGQFDLAGLSRAYAETLSALDDSIGAILDAVDQRGQTGNTLFVYMGDNGYLLGEQGLIDKRVMHDPSIRVPLLASWPGRIPARSAPDPIALNIDIAPTILEAAGVLAPAAMHGRSLLPLFNPKPPAWRDGFLYEYFWDWEALHTPGVLGYRNADFSLMEYQGIWDLQELYDMRHDPAQLHNLVAHAHVTVQSGGWIRRIADPQLRSTVRSLRGRMGEILRATGGSKLARGPE